MPPLRAKGLAGIRALLLARDAPTMALLSEIVSVLETALDDPESFVFLAAINTLVALADVSPSQSLPLLANRLSDETIGTPLRLMLTEVNCERSHFMTTARSQHDLRSAIQSVGQTVGLWAAAAMTMQLSQRQTDRQTLAMR